MYKVFTKKISYIYTYIYIYIIDYSIMKIDVINIYIKKSQFRLGTTVLVSRYEIT